MQYSRRYLLAEFGKGYIASKEMKVALFGLSGNPPTGPGGHGGIVAFLSSLGSFDEIWVLPVYRHMYSHKRRSLQDDGSPTFKQRVDMCKLGFQTCCESTIPVKVLEIEKTIYLSECQRKGTKDARLSTWTIICRLQNSHPNVKFSFVLGYDAYEDLTNGKWANSKELLENIDFLVVSRQGFKGAQGAAVIHNNSEVHYVHDLTGVSSTELRNTDDIEVLENPVNMYRNVLEYIKTNRLYHFHRQRRSRKALQNMLLFVGGTAVATVLMLKLLKANRRSKMLTLTRTQD